MTGLLRRAWDRLAGRLDPESRDAWAAARSLADVGELTARWLNRDLPQHPGYPGAEGPDPETMPWNGHLAAANRAGLVTHGSQPGLDVTDPDGARWQQVAVVGGYADAETVSRLRAVAAGTGLRVSTDGRLFDATWRDGRAVTGFGAVLDDGLTRFTYRGCPAAGELCRAMQVTIWDPDPGRNDRLWGVLDRFSGRHVPEPRPAKAPDERPPDRGTPPAPPAAEPPDVAALAGALAKLRDQADATADALQAAGVTGQVLGSLLATVEALATAHAAAGRVVAGLTR